MPRKQQTPEQIAARVAKGKATKAANKAAALASAQRDGVVVLATVKPKYKYRKKRNLTDEQKAAAVERLAKARDSKGPSQNTQIAEEVRLLPDEHTFSLKNVRSWIKSAKEHLQAMKGMATSKEGSDRAQYLAAESYVSNLEQYLRTGTYTDHRYGEIGASKVKYVCRGMAYYADGTPKRTVGVVYPDIGEYTQEMENEAFAQPKKKRA